MKYLVLALLVVTALADEDVAVDNAAFPINSMMNMNRMGYSVMGNTMFIPKPPQKAIDHYNSLSNDDFPVDYSMSCSNTCGCRQTCVVMWWMPCSCMCPPPCPETTTQTITVLPWQPPRMPRPEPIPPQNQWNPRPGPEPIPPQNQWNPRPGPEPIPPQQNQRPWQPVPPPPQNPQFPSFPNLNVPRLTTAEPTPLTFPPQPWPGTPSPCSNAPTWNQPPNQWNPEPIWPQPQPDPWQRPNNPSPWQPEPLPEPQWPWQQAPIQPIVPLPEPLPPTSWNNNNNQFPNHWPQQPAPPRQDCNVCNNQCSCTPCSVIWVCPQPCPDHCCNGACARHFGDAEDVADYQKEVAAIDEKESNKVAFHFIPEYLQDIFVPGMI